MDIPYVGIVHFKDSDETKNVTGVYKGSDFNLLNVKIMDITATYNETVSTPKPATTPT